MPMKHSLPCPVERSLGDTQARDGTEPRANAAQDAEGPVIVRNGRWECRGGVCCLEVVTETSGHSLGHTWAATRKILAQLLAAFISNYEINEFLQRKNHVSLRGKMFSNTIFKGFNASLDTCFTTDHPLVLHKNFDSLCQ